MTVLVSLGTLLPVAALWNECDLYGAPLRGGYPETTGPSSCCITNKAAAETRIALYAGMLLLSGN